VAARARWPRPSDEAAEKSDERGRLVGREQLPKQNLARHELQATWLQAEATRQARPAHPNPPVQPPENAARTHARPAACPSDGDAGLDFLDVAASPSPPPGRPSRVGEGRRAF